MWRWHMRVQTWILAYLGAIVFFATVYFLLPSGQFSQRLSLLDAFYFSVITITTTGFGDITAHGNLAKICVSVEATAGITIVGLFLASLWREFTQRVEMGQEARLLKNHQIIGRATLFLYWRYIGSTVAEYRRRAAEYNPLAIINSGASRDMAEQIFENEDRLEDDLRYLLANEVIDEYADARLAVFKVLSILRASKVRTAALRTDNAGPDAAEVFAKHVQDTLEALKELEIAMDNLLSGEAVFSRDGTHSLSA